MPIRTEKRRFTRKNIDQVPARPGVYGLYTDDGVAFYGVARCDGSIRDRLAAHLSGRRTPDGSAARYFNFEVTRFPLSRGSALLEEHRRINMQLPPFNVRTRSAPSTERPAGRIAGLESRR